MSIPRIALASILLASLLGSPATAQAPPAQNPANGNWYAEIPVENFFEARTIGTIYGGFIADLVDATERQWAVGQFGDGESTFIGLTDEINPGVFLWESGTPLIDTDWAPGQPTNETPSRYVQRFTEWTTGNSSSAAQALIETPTMISPAVPTMTCAPAIGEVLLAFDAPGFSEVSIVRDNLLIVTLPLAMGTYLDSVSPGTHRYAIVGSTPTSVSLPGRCEVVVPDPNYRFHIPDLVAPTGTPATGPVLLDHTVGNVNGFSLGVCLDSTEVTVSSVVEGGALEAFGGSKFFAAAIEANGFYAGAVFAFSCCATLSPGEDQEILRFVAEGIGSGAMTELRPCSGEVGAPPAFAAVVVLQESIPPLLEAGSILFLDENFRRADTNLDGVINVADPIFLGSILFDPQVTEFPCRESCDSNGDAQVDIADMVTTIGYLFFGGPAPGAPFPDCGPDPSPADSLGCEEILCL